MMKNINADGMAVMAGKKWVGTPFCFNYGYPEHGYEDDYIETDYEKGVTTCTNYFGITKSEYIQLIKKWASPKHYDRSFYLGDMSYAIYGAPNKKFNVIQLLFKDNKLKIATCWLDFNRKPDLESRYPKFTKCNLTSDDYNLLACIDIETKIPKLVTFCVMHFKYTMELYKDNFYIRFSKGFKNKDIQFAGDVRMDAGRDEETDRYEQFSILRSYLIPNKIAELCIEKIDMLKELDEYDE
jgi:hypothetical protein